MNYNVLRLEEVAEVFDCPHSSPKWTDKGIPVIRNYNLVDGHIDQSRLSFTDNECYLNRIKKAVPVSEDIVLSREAPMGRVGIIPNNFKCCLGQRLVLLKVKRNVCISHWLLYCLQSDYVQNQIKSYDNIGTTVSNLGISTIKNLQIPVPSFEYQKRAVDAIKPIDDLIAVNCKINDYLFEVCKILFNEARKKSTEYSALTTFAEICYGKDHKDLSEGTIPVFGSGGIMRYVDRALYQGNESVLVPRKGSLNNILYVSEPFWSVDTMFYTKMKKKHCGKYLYFYLLSIDMELMNAGSAVPSMTTEILDKMIIPNPGNDVLEQFDTAAQPFFDMIKNKKKVNNKLESYRQALIKKMFDE